MPKLRRDGTFGRLSDKKIAVCRALLAERCADQTNQFSSATLIQKQRRPVYICSAAPARAVPWRRQQAARRPVFRSALRPYFALLLLLCLSRTLLPEAWVLALHPHPHTTQEAAHAASHKQPRLLLTTRHQHCYAEQFYNVPFAANSKMLLPQPRRQPRYVARPVARVRAGLGPARSARGQRGPPDWEA